MVVGDLFDGRLCDGHSFSEVNVAVLSNRPSPTARLTTCSF